MSILLTSRKLYLASKTINRMTQILSVFSKYGLAYIIEQIGLEKYIPFKLRVNFHSSSQGLPERLRLAFEELGPVYVKLGQFISMREDLFSSEWSSAMRTLQD